MTKQYVHFEDLVTMLNEDKNMNPQTINQKIFKEISYVSLINPYKDYICLNHEEEAHRVYPSEVSFDDFKQLKMIDNFISNRLFVYIRTFEEALTANLYLILSNKMASLGDSTCSDFSVFEELLEEGENQLDMLDIYHRYENTKIIKANDKIVKKNKEVLIKFIQLGKKEVSLNNDLYNHYQQNYLEMPVWVVLEQLSLGEMQTLFNLIKIKDKYQFVEQVSHKKVNPRNVATFSNKINYIRLIRNRICHNTPMISFIKSCITEDEKHRLINTIRFLKIHYYNSSFHDCSHVCKPLLNLDVNEQNQSDIIFLEWVLKTI